MGLLSDGAESRTLEIVQGRILMYAEQPERALKQFKHVLKEYGSDKWIHFLFSDGLRRT